MAREFDLRGISHQCQVAIPIEYKGMRMNAFHRADMICLERIVVEVKALRTLSGTKEAQLLNDLMATDLHRGLLFTFGTSRLQIKRMVHGYLERGT